MLTQTIPRKYHHISYTIENDEEEEKKDEKTNGNKEEHFASTDVNENNIITTRTRGANRPQQNKDLEMHLKKSQSQLLDKKV